jgi:hypothetical protein
VALRTQSLVLLCLLVLPCVACPSTESDPVAPSAASQGQEAEADLADVEIRGMVASEELLLSLSLKLFRLDASARNLQLPDHRSRSLFAAELVERGLSAAPSSNAVSLERAGLSRRSWELGPERKVPRRTLSLWRPFLDGIRYFENATFKFKDAAPLQPADATWRADLAFNGLARTHEGSWRGIQARVDTHWARSDASEGPDDPGWRITRFALTSFETLEAESLLFSEVTGDALVEPAVRDRVSDSIHEKRILEMVAAGDDYVPQGLFRVSPTDVQPGLAVVDIDRDGFDDLYVLDRWGKALFLRNRGDGSFEEIAGELGLDFEDRNCCAAFGDYDNDGDMDVFVGRTLKRSLYLVNEDGVFVDRSDWVNTYLPGLVTSISAVDYDNDGLLDVYFSTYAGDLIHVQETRRSREGGKQLPLIDYLGERDAEILARKLREVGHHITPDGALVLRSEVYRDRVGPPNILLRNAGNGRFERTPLGDQLAVWRNTFQSSWSDYDGDGDQDLYVANDFAPNNLFRNDGEAGFSDITQATGTADIGFGMGASWGDYNNDGRRDLYFSNMYSSAGRRLTRVSGLDPRLASMARGNTLFHNDEGAFDKVSGLSAPALRVENAGWSWGGQFVDVDNDGFLDLYASSGMYTAPRQIRIRGADR